MKFLNNLFTEDEAFHTCKFGKGRSLEGNGSVWETYYSSRIYDLQIRKREYSKFVIKRCLSIANDYKHPEDYTVTFVRSRPRNNHTFLTGQNAFDSHDADILHFLA